MEDKSQAFGSPIPGANYTSDTKNYPWHRPPEITNLDDAIEVSFKKLTEENAAEGLLTMLEMGASIASLTHTFVMSGIGAGKWTPDFAILLAGPVSHIIYLMAKGYGIDADMGISDKVRPPSKAFFKARQIDSKKLKSAIKEIPPELIKSNAGSATKADIIAPAGFMAMGQEPLEEESAEEPMEMEGMF